MSHWAKLSVLLGKSTGVLGLGLLAVVGGVFVMRRKRSNEAAVDAYQAVAAKGPPVEPPTLHPEINPVLCAGCGACVKVCPEGDILQMINHKAVLVSPGQCVGHGMCEAACPFSAITLVFGSKTRGVELPRITGNYETNVKGLYIAGEISGMGLIRNAVKQGKLAVEHLAESLGSSEGAADAEVDLVVVGAGPAGISATLAAIEAGLTYRLIEQGAFGGSIANYPRQKLVMSKAAELPLVGPMNFGKGKVPKEALLAFFNKVRTATGLVVQERCRLLGLKKDGEVFLVGTSSGPVTARRVVLAMGVRGTPRKLRVPGEELPKVTYDLLEPEQYRSRQIVVVGGGNAAAEAAHRLGEVDLFNRVTLLVRGKALDRANVENQQRTEEMAQAGLIDIYYDTVLNEIHPDHVVIEREGRPQRLENDYVFIFAGAELPFAFLKTLGIEIEKKFGEGIKKRPVRPTA